MPSPIQLDLFIDRPVRKGHAHFDILALGGDNGWVIRSWVGVAGLILKADPRGDSCLCSKAIEMRVDLRHGEPFIDGPGHDAHWDMTRALSRRRGAARDVFQLTLDRIFASAPVWGGAASDDRARSYRWLAFQVSRLLDFCEPGARRIAMRFQPEVRFSVYAELVRDPNGRMRQLAAVCPGAVAIVAAARGNSTMAGAIARFRASVATGRRLDVVVDDLVQGCARVEGLDELSTSVRTLWRLLIRKAGPRVAAVHLMVPPPLAFIAEDIPTDGKLQARWFKLMAGEAAWRSTAATPSRLACAFSAFVARNALKLTGAGGDLVFPAAEWLEALEVRRILPDRRSAPERLIEVVRHHMWICELRAVDPAVKQTLLRTGDGPLPAPPFPDWTDGPNAVVAIRTVQQLLREGRVMGHCVGAYADGALSERSFFFSARLPLARLTVQLDAVGDSFVLVGIRGTRNREPTRSERRALEPWLAHVRKHRPSAVAHVSELEVMIARLEAMRQALAGLVTRRPPDTRRAPGVRQRPARR
jgi:hypothetical protein